MSKAHGFTLIELMIVVAIIAILAAIATSAYQNYVVRSEVSEGIVLADGQKTNVVTFYNNKGYFPADNQSAGIVTSTSIIGSYVSQLDVGGGGPGVMQITYGNQVHPTISGLTLLMSAYSVGGGSVAWRCRSTTIPSKYLPSSCH